MIPASKNLHIESVAIRCAMHIESVPNRKSHPKMLLRESYRADGNIKPDLTDLVHLESTGG